MKHCMYFFVIALFASTLISNSEKLDKNCNVSISYAKEDGIDDQYIVILKDELTDEETDEIIRSLEAEDAKVLHRYKPIASEEMESLSGDKFHGFSIKVDESKRKETLELIKQNCGIKYIEQNQISSIATCQTETKSGWCLAKIVSKNNKYVYPSNAGKKSTIYIIDTGCKETHPELKGRISKKVNFVIGESDEDLNGHGTSTASLAGGIYYGAAKSAKLVCVKAYNKNGKTTVSDVINAINWCVSEKKYGIICLASNPYYNKGLNDAVANAYKKGLLSVVAAGNQKTDAKIRSPASENKALTVASSNQTNYFSNFSYYGSKIKIVAPGESCSCAIAKGNKYGECSGTSVSAALVAGVAAIIQTEYNLTKTIYSPKNITKIILNLAKKNKVNNVPANTKNKLLYYKCV